MNKTAFTAGIVLLALALSMLAVENTNNTGISPATAEIFFDLPLAILGSLLVALSFLALRCTATIALVIVIVLILIYLLWLAFRILPASLHPNGG